jgi:Tfp pilus assembly protein PilN
MRAVNLLPSETKRTREKPSVAVQLALVAPLVVAGLLQDDLAALPPPPAQRQGGNPALVSERALRIAALSTALQSRLVWDRILRQISAVLPGDVWLTTLSGQGPTPAPPPPPPTTTTTDTTTTTTTTTSAPAPPPPPVGGPLSLVGYTYSQEGVARLLSRLAVVPALQDVKLVQSQQSDVAGQTVVSFTISATVRPEQTG